MMTFKARLFASTTAIVASVLTLVMLLGWSRVMQFEIARLDTQLCIEAKRIASPDYGQSLSVRLSENLASKLRVDSESQLQWSIQRENTSWVASSLWYKQLPTKEVQWSSPKPVPKTYSAKIENRQSLPKSQRVETCQLSTFDWQQKQWRASLYSKNGVSTIIAVDLAVTENELQQAIHSILYWILPFALLLSALSAWLIASMTMRPINRLTDAMKSITQKDLNQRLPTSGEDKEFAILIEAYNDMLERLERSFQQASRFSADATHELKTPLTILRGRLEQAVNNSNPALLDINNLLDEVGTLSAITRKLLLLSQADAGTLAIQYQNIDLTLLLTELFEDVDLINDQITWDTNIETALEVQGDLVLLRQLINNLFSNAIRYHQPNSVISIKAKRIKSGVEIIFGNKCISLNSEQRSQMFDRFYRGSYATDNVKKGSGLGLSLSREIARSHHGELTLLESNADEVHVRLYLHQK
ncbi:ATP-binding protein [Psychromonas sp. KJ10-10]|uniref:ATP-binding protein n=1 Tax=Psychromonas sp. KJ10-10 TaxID=3391823 RepID=UPI0039B41AEE